MLRGRDFSVADFARASSVAVVNETLARQLWPGRDPIGMHAWIDGNAVEIVGVSADYNSVLLRSAPPAMFVPLSQQMNAFQRLDFLIRASNDPADIASVVRAEI